VIFFIDGQKNSFCLLKFVILFDDRREFSQKFIEICKLLSLKEDILQKPLNLLKKSIYRELIPVKSFFEIILLTQFRNYQLQESSQNLY